MARPDIGTRVQLHPATDYWMRGERYGEVTGYTASGNVRLVLDRGGRTVTVHPDNITPLTPGARDAQLRTAIMLGLSDCDGCCLDNTEEQLRVCDAIMERLRTVGVRETERPVAPHVHCGCGGLCDSGIPCPMAHACRCGHG